MSRSTKQFAYGLFYLVVLALIVWGGYSVTIKPAPSCFDKSQNQGEAGVDCGGPCVSCEVLRLENLRVLGQVKVFGLQSGRAVLLAEVLNPNTDYGAKEVVYRFKIHDKDDLLTTEISGKENFYPGERRYIYEANVSEPFQKISKVQLEFSKPEWQSAKAFFRSSLSLENHKTEATDNVVRVVGEVRNEGPLSVSGISVIALLFDQFGVELFASKTLISELKGLEEKPFIVFFPSDEDLKNRADPNLTKIFLSSK